MGDFRRRAGLAVAASLLASCATARNFLDSGPRFAGAYARVVEPERTPRSIRVVSFNLKYARQVPRAIALFRTDPALKDADIIALQEMDEAGMEAMARALGLNYVYYPAAYHPRGRANFGNGLLSRWPLTGDGKIPLPHPGRFRRMVRIAVRAEVQVGKVKIRAYSVHLETPFAISGGQRRAQLEAVLEDADEEPRVIIAGDFNNHDLVGAYLQKSGFQWLTRPVRATIGGFAWDHLFVRGLWSKERSFGRAAANGGASDHRPVWVELDLTRGP